MIYLGLCPGDLVKTPCDGQCRSTCGESQVCSTQCLPGCTCPSGKVRKSDPYSTKCIPEVNPCVSKDLYNTISIHYTVYTTVFVSVVPNIFAHTSPIIMSKILFTLYMVNMVMYKSYD